MTPHGSPKADRLRQLGWLIAIWAASVAALAVVALAFRAVMGAAGLTTG